MQEFLTTDVDLAAYLVCRGETLRRVQPPERPPWLAEFAFIETPRVLACLREWGADEEGRRVDAREFAKQRFRLYKRAREAVDGVRPEHRRGRA